MHSSAAFEAARRRMLGEQLQARGIRSHAVLEAMDRVPRERFVPEDARGLAYSDRALAISCRQTISQPYIVGLMTEALEIGGGETVLEIGTGSGYQTAVLAELAGRVVTVERHVELSRQAAALLADLGFANISFVVGDGTLGWPAEAPYPRIIATAAAACCPPALFEQLAEGGLLVIPLGEEEGQTIQAIRKIGGQPRSTLLIPCRFVPLIGEQGWQEHEV